VRVILQIDVVPIYDFWMRLIARKQIKPRPNAMTAFPSKSRRDEPLSPNNFYVNFLPSVIADALRKHP
jgi:hypothetical protein